MLSGPRKNVVKNIPVSAEVLFDIIVAKIFSVVLIFSVEKGEMERVYSFRIDDE